MMGDRAFAVDLSFESRTKSSEHFAVAMIVDRIRDLAATLRTSFGIGSCLLIQTR